MRAGVSSCRASSIPIVTCSRQHCAAFLANGLLLGGTPGGDINYFQFILLTFAPVYGPQDIYINELFGSLSQLDAGVTTVHDISQIHHSPEHWDAAIKGIMDSGRRAAFGHFEGAGFTHGPNYNIRTTRWASRSGGSRRVTSSSP
jgi:5-methylthioadenosine/S-adenosylhomocysteine deaminase